MGMRRSKWGEQWGEVERADELVQLRDDLHRVLPLQAVHERGELLADVDHEGAVITEEDHQ